jgi:hypothetical protein
MARCKGDIPVVWDDIIQQGCSSWFHKSLKYMICHLVLSSTVYNILLARNEIGPCWTTLHRGADS